MTEHLFAIYPDDLGSGAAADITFSPTGSISSTNVQAAIAEVDTDLTALTAALAAHLVDAIDAHDATAISFTAVGFTAIEVQAAIVEVQGNLAGHIVDAVDAHDASAISFVAGGSLSATDVQTAIAEVATDYLAAIAALSAVYQPLDADLTSWAAITRAAGFDTFVATPSSANLKSLVTDETGSGALVFGTSPTLASATIGLADGLVGTPSLFFTSDPDVGLFLAGVNTIGIVEAGVNIARSVAVTSVSDPNGASATGRMFAMLNEDWQLEANKFWIRSSDLSIHPAQVQVTGTWVAADVARIRFNTGAVNYDFAYTVQGGDTNAIIAGGLRTAILADATFIALPVYPQALNTTTAKFDVCFMYPQYPITLTNNGSSTAAGTFTFTQATNLLDGPVGLNIQRLSPGRAPIAEDDCGDIIWWGPYAAGGNGVSYGRISVFIADPALVTLQGRMQFMTADSSITDTLNRMILRKGLYMTTSTGASPSGGTGGDMGAGTINVPDATGYYVNGKGYFRSNGDNLQIINTTAAGVLQLGANGNGVVNVDSNNFYPETTASSDLGKTSTREWRNLFFAEGSYIDWDNNDVRLTQTASVLSLTGGVFNISNSTTFRGRLGQQLSVDNSADYGGVAFTTWSTTADQAPLIDIARSKSATIGTHTTVASGDSVGGLVWRASDGTGFVNAAAILSAIDGAVGTNDMPGRLDFYTTPDASSTLTRRMYLDSAGKLTQLYSFRIDKNGGASTLTSVLSPMCELISADTTRATLEMQSSGTNGSTNPLIIYAYSRGTVASPTATQSNDRMGANFAWGYGATGWLTSAGAGFIMTASENYTDSAGGSRVEIWTTPIGSVTLAIAATFAADKSLVLGGWLGRGAPATKTGDFTLATTENWVICNSGSTIVVTLPAASSFTGREVYFKTIQASLVNSASSNVVPNTTGTAGTAILPATDGAWCIIVSDGTNWIRMASSTIA